MFKHNVGDYVTLADNFTWAKRYRVIDRKIEDTILYYQLYWKSVKNPRLTQTIWVKSNDVINLRKTNENK